MISELPDPTLRSVDLRQVEILDLPLALVILHRELPIGGRIHVRLTADIEPDAQQALVEGGGFGIEHRGASDSLCVRRADTLPDFVASKMRLLICGLNPSLHAAQSGIPFSRPGNRFWPAAVRAGLVDQARDCIAALVRGIGFTDLVKRATRRTDELSSAEYRRGIERVAALARMFEPATFCFVGLDGYRRAVDPKAVTGWLPGGFAGCSAYLMPSTSGLNVHASVETATRHLRIAASGRRFIAS